MADEGAATIDPDVQDGGTSDPSAGTSRRPPRRRLLKRIAIGIGVAVLALALLGALLYSFGGMERPVPAQKAAFASMVAAGSATPVQSRFVIPIPGCRCHSDDPVQQVQHATYRIRECSSCH